MRRMSKYENWETKKESVDYISNIFDNPAFQYHSNNK